MPFLVGFTNNIGKKEDLLLQGLGQKETVESVWINPVTHTAHTNVSDTLRDKVSCRSVSDTVLTSKAGTLIL